MSAETIATSSPKITAFDGSQDAALSRRQQLALQLERNIFPYPNEIARCLQTALETREDIEVMKFNPAVSQKEITDQRDFLFEMSMGLTERGFRDEASIIFDKTSRTPSEIEKDKVSRKTNKHTMNGTAAYIARILDRDQELLNMARKGSNTPTTRT